MNDVLLGTIIGGAIGVGGSAIVAWIQARRSERQQWKQIEHERASELLSRRIAVRSKYLVPLTSDLCNVYVSGADCLRKLCEVIGPYCAGKEVEQVRVPAVDKEEFIREMREIRSLSEKMIETEYEVFKTSGQVADAALLNKLSVIPKGITGLRDGFDQALRSLRLGAAGQDFVYDFGPVSKELQEILLRMPGIHSRIESLLAGVEEDIE